MTVTVADGSPPALLDVLQRVLAEPNEFSEDFDAVEFGDWVRVRVYVPEPEIQSAITPPFMEAFLVLQRQVYQFGALVKTGVADAGQLSEADRRDLQINIVVTGGSSNYLAELKEPLGAALKKMLGELSGRQAMTVIISLAAFLAASWS